MKHTILMMAVLISFCTATAQPKLTDLDRSPLDVSYYPPNYPILKMSGKASGDPMARVLYSRPQKKDRNIFGGEVKYNEIWRIGANESTEIELFKNAVLAGTKVPKGRYTLFCLPAENKWTIILNKDNFMWGSFSYKSDRDAARIEVPVERNEEEVEALTMYFQNNGKPGLMILWDTTKVLIPITFQ